MFSSSRFRPLSRLTRRHLGSDPKNSNDSSSFVKEGIGTAALIIGCCALLVQVGGIQPMHLKITEQVRALNEVTDRIKSTNDQLQKRVGYALELERQISEKNNSIRAHQQKYDEKS